MIFEENVIASETVNWIINNKNCMLILNYSRVQISGKETD